MEKEDKEKMMGKGRKEKTREMEKQTGGIEGYEV